MAYPLSDMADFQAYKQQRNFPESLSDEMIFQSYITHQTTQESIELEKEKQKTALLQQERPTSMSLLQAFRKEPRGYVKLKQHIF